MSIKKAQKRIMKLYGGLGWPTVFTYIRVFITAPFKALEPLISKKGFIIDLGCGYGIFSNLLGLMSEERKILGLDLDNYKIKRADKKIKNVTFQIADITKIDIPIADSILLIHVLHHLNSYQEQEILLRACLDKLKTGGKLIIAEIDKKPWWKFKLTQLADRMLYPGDEIFYRFPDNMMLLLNKFNIDTEKKIMHKQTPFSHITYVCTKR